jgi:hypothetical protein
VGERHSLENLLLEQVTEPPKGAIGEQPVRVPCEDTPDGPDRAVEPKGRLNACRGGRPADVAVLCE